MVTVTGPITFTKGGDWGVIYATASGVTLPFKATTWTSDRYATCVSTNTYAVDPDEKHEPISEPTPIPMPTPQHVDTVEPTVEHVVEGVEPTESIQVEMHKKRRKLK